LEGVIADAIGSIEIGGDLTSNVAATHPGGFGNGVNSITAQGNILGNVSALNGRIGSIIAYGHIGTSDLLPKN
jgi:hypothetical protein